MLFFVVVVVFCLVKNFKPRREEVFTYSEQNASSWCEGFWELASHFHIHEYYKHDLQQMPMHTSVISFVFKQRENMASNNVHLRLPGESL